MRVRACMPVGACACKTYVQQVPMQPYSVQQECDACDDQNVEPVILIFTGSFVVVAFCI